MPRIAILTFAVSLALPGWAIADDRQQLIELETASHGWWHDGAKEKMRELMADDDFFVAPNGALRTALTTAVWQGGDLSDYSNDPRLNSVATQGERP